MGARSASLVVAAALCTPVCRASVPDSPEMEEQLLASSELKAEQAPPNARCYAYAQLVHQTVEYSARQYAAGKPDRATEMLRRTQSFARGILMRLTRDTKKVKDSEILLRRSAFRLQDLLHAGSADDRAPLEETLAQIDKTRQALLLRLFGK